MSQPLLNFDYQPKGKAPTLLLIHGLFGDGDNLKGTARALEDKYATLTVDLRNHGDSFHSDDMNYTDMATDILAVLNELDIESVHVLGHSMGGKVAMEMALNYPDRVTSAIFADIAPVAYQARHNGILDALAALPLDSIKSRQEADKELAKHIDSYGVRQFLLKNLRKDDNGYHLRLNLPVLQTKYDEILGLVSDGCYAGPVLFIKGGASDYLTTEHQTAVKQRFPNAEVKVIEGAGHWLHAEKPRVFNRLVEQFLTRQRGDEN